MKDEERRRIRGRIEEVILRVVRPILSEGRASEHVAAVRNKFSGLPTDALADILIKRAARKTMVEGIGAGAAVTGCEIVLAAPVPEPGHKVAAVAGVAGSLVGDVSYTTGVQMQLVLDIAHLYRCPYNPGDEDDVWLILKAALGIKGVGGVGAWGGFVFNEAARKQFRRFLRTGIRRAMQEYALKVTGPKVAKFLAEKYAMRLLPFANMAIAGWFNYRTTRSVGKWGKIKAKIRSSVFRQIDLLKGMDDDAKLWVLPVIYWVGTA